MTFPGTCRTYEYTTAEDLEQSVTTLEDEDSGESTLMKKGLSKIRRPGSKTDTGRRLMLKKRKIGQAWALIGFQVF